VLLELLPDFPGHANAVALQTEDEIFKESKSKIVYLNKLAHRMSQFKKDIQASLGRTNDWKRREEKKYEISNKKKMSTINFNGTHFPWAF
jgi:hypothetical protein